MHVFRLLQQLHRQRLSRLFAPRRPRHPLLRVLLGLTGVALLLVLLVAGVVIGIAMLSGGLLHRLWKQRGRPMATAPSSAIDGDYRVLSKSAMPLVR